MNELSGKETIAGRFYLAYLKNGFRKLLVHDFVWKMDGQEFSEKDFR